MNANFEKINIPNGMECMITFFPGKNRISKPYAWFTASLNAPKTMNYIVLRNINGKTIVAEEHRSPRHGNAQNGLCKM